MEQPTIPNNLFQQAVAFVRQTNQHLFLTGKAGTGKTTFLKYIRQHCFKKLAVVAPTGVAAINAGGVTIHSFLQLPFGMYLPAYPSAWGNVESNIYNKNQLLGKLRLSAPKRELIRELDLLVIDEISMVRADLLDAMDAVLRAVRRRPDIPFGGVQMLYIGDLFQLPPVIKDAEWELMRDIYRSPFFFDAQVIGEAPPVYLELKHIYRQSDPRFIHLLNNVRNNSCTTEDLQDLHAHYQPHFSPPGGEGYITLTSHNYKADAINRDQLEKLPGRVYKPEADIKGDFPENAYPAPRVLHLKAGAQIMFIKNDKGESRRYFNGKIGIIQQIDEKGKKILVAFPNEPDPLELSLETWKNIRYQYDKEKDRIQEEELGSFIQYPVRLAWAITIHKSQGLTFEKAVVDAGAAFAPGQVYVALSRLTSLNGLILRSPILSGSILTDTRITDLPLNVLPEEGLQQILEASQYDFVCRSLSGAFEWNGLVEKITLQVENTAHITIPDKLKETAWCNKLRESIQQQQEVAEKFGRQLESLLEQASGSAGYSLLHERVQKAVDWFTKDLEEKAVNDLQAHIKAIKIIPRTKKYVKTLQDLLPVFERKQQQLKQAVIITDALQQSLALPELMEQVEALHRPADPILPEDTAPALKSAKPPKGATRRISLKMHREGESIEAIAAARGMAKSTIEGHLSEFIATGEVDIHALVAPDKLEKILAVLQADPKIGSSGIREKLGTRFSYGEIKAAMAYWQLNRKIL